jgi:opacity protein-like surface antigen
MMKRLLAAAAALALTAGVAQAATVDIDVQVFTTDKYEQILATMGTVVVEDFEEAGPEGNRANGFGTKVGTFASLGGRGNGLTVTEEPGGSSGNFPGNDGTKLAIRDGNVFGRQSTTAMLTGDAADDQFLDSNDTKGISWSVDIGSAFTRILLTLTDATDVGAIMKITANGVSESFNNLKSSGVRNGNIQILLIDFGAPVETAEITFFNSRTNGSAFMNDGFSIDDIAVSAVPLPAPALMLLAGLGGLAALRRKRAAA